MNSCTLLVRSCHIIKLFGIETAAQKSLHVSASLLKKKKPFYNRHIKAFLNRQPSTGFVYEVAKKSVENEVFRDKEDEYDIQQEALWEDRRRRKASAHSRFMRDLNKGPGPRLLTWDQMEQVRFLNQQYSEEWNIEMLAHSFQVPPLVIRKVLRSKKVLNERERNRIDAKARANQGYQKALPSTETEQKLSAGTSLIVAKDEKQKSSSLELPDWFRGYSKTKPLKIENRPNLAKLQNHDPQREEKNEIKWLDEEESEFFSHLYSASEFNEDEDHDEELDMDEEEEDEEERKIELSSDGDNIFKINGEFLYKI